MTGNSGQESQPSYKTLRFVTGIKAGRLNQYMKLKKSWQHTHQTGYQKTRTLLIYNNPIGNESFDKQTFKFKS